MIHIKYLVKNVRKLKYYYYYYYLFYQNKSIFFLNLGHQFLD